MPAKLNGPTSSRYSIDGAERLRTSIISTSSSSSLSRVGISERSGPVAGGAVTPRIKLPKRKDPSTTEAARSAENRSAESERASNVDRDNEITPSQLRNSSSDLQTPKLFSTRLNRGAAVMLP